MSDDVDLRAAAFWRWLVGEAPQIRSAFQRAAAGKDYPALQGLCDRVGAELAKVAGGLLLQLNGGGEGELRMVIVSPSPELTPTIDRVLALAPALEGWTFGKSLESAPLNVIVRDDRGRELKVPYADVRFVLLPPKPDGSVSVMFVIDREFDPRSELGHLYQAAATELIKNAFGAQPRGMGSYALVPMSWIGDRDARPVSELAERWRAR